MAESSLETLEQSLPPKEAPLFDEKLSMDIWRKIFRTATINWYEKLEPELKSKRTKDLNLIMSDPASDSLSQSKARDIVYARGVMASSLEPYQEGFPKSKGVSVRDALGGEGVLFMLENLPPNHEYYDLFHRIAYQEDLTWQATMDRPHPAIPRPEFMSTIVKKWENGG